MSKRSPEAEQLQKQILSKLESLRDTVLDNANANSQPIAKSNMNLGRELRGHFQKVYAIDWEGNDGDTIVSASQDGKLIVWNALSTNKLNAIPLKSCWVMAAAFEKTRSDLVASGGLSNVCSIFKLVEHEVGASVVPDFELFGHQGYISCCKFIDDKKIMTSSGDGTCKVWDIQEQTCLATCSGHTGDVMSVAPSPINPNIFISGSVDYECKVWDIRQKRSEAAAKASARTPQETFLFGFGDDPNDDEGDSIESNMFLFGHDSDVNSVTFFPDGNAFASGSDDASCRLWDLRTFQEVNRYHHHTILCGVTSTEFSKSGRILFAGYDDNRALGWDTLHGSADQGVEPALVLSPHDSKVSSIALQSGGRAVATGSWDTLIKIHA